MLKKFAFSMILSTLCFLCLTLDVEAAEKKCQHGYYTFDDFKMGYGVGDYGKNRRYYYESGFNSTYSNYISDAVSEWVHTSTEGPHVKTSISIRKTTNKSLALFELVSDNALGTYVLGETKFYLYQEELPLINGTLTKNYGWSKIYLNVNLLNTIPAAQRKGTVAHEFGHAMGLSHQDRIDSIMCQFGRGRKATRADATDCNTINHIYG